ncbi:uncharacterized protein N7503_008490 [Penicillium pulvis]|uniref:uncharacterized protein n=1 Tax=Penicillium pulvis TaxID=1562058 RepID=UPI0025471E3A|nr:uncharacterized protein N7503_008490 [Penicillium pulvis]KAJ5792512.1 hypothetical protein N7503_008490 [Penicillium pulvis]
MGEAWAPSQTNWALANNYKTTRIVYQLPMEYQGPATRSAGGAGTPRVPGTVHSGDPASRSARANNAIGGGKQKNVSFSFKKRCSSRVFIAQCALAVDLALHRRLGGRRILHRVDLVQARPSYPSAALHRGGSPCPRHRAKNQEWDYLERQTGGFRYRLLWTFEKVI